MSRKLSKLIADFESSLVGRMLSDNPRTEKNYKAARKALRTALSEAEQQVQDAKRIATNAEHYGYLHGLEAAVLLAKKMQADALTGSAREHAGHFEEVLRALIPSEPHDAEGRE